MSSYSLYSMKLLLVPYSVLKWNLFGVHVKRFAVYIWRKIFSLNKYQCLAKFGILAPLCIWVMHPCCRRWSVSSSNRMVVSSNPAPFPSLLSLLRKTLYCKWPRERTLSRGLRSVPLWQLRRRCNAHQLVAWGYEREWCPLATAGAPPLGWCRHPSACLRWGWRCCWRPSRTPSPACTERTTSERRNDCCCSRRPLLTCLKVQCVTSGFIDDFYTRKSSTYCP